MKAYKCDICGKYVDDAFGTSGFSILQGDFRKHGFDNRRVDINEVCEDCYDDIKNIILDKFFTNYNEG